jgi:hypothetical protein
VTINPIFERYHTYSCTEAILNSAQIAANIAAQINASNPYCTAMGPASSALKPAPAGDIQVTSGDGSVAATLQNYIHSVTLGDRRTT